MPLIYLNILNNFPHICYCNQSTLYEIHECTILDKTMRNKKTDCMLRNIIKIFNF